jgi:hypothetical protein
VEATAYQPAPHSNITNDAEDMIIVSVTNGNTERATQLVSAFANALSDQNTDQTEPGESEAQLSSARQTRSVLASGLSTIAKSAQNFSSDKLRLVAQATSAVASVPEQVSSAALEGTVNSLSAIGSANAMEGKVNAPEGAQCSTTEVCTPHCRKILTCVDGHGAIVTPVIEPVDPALITSVVLAISNVTYSTQISFFILPALLCMNQ